MKITLAIPIDIDDKAEFQNTAAAVEIAQAAERAGADAVNLTDHPAPTHKWRQGGGHDALDPFAGLAFVAAATTKVRLHTNLIVLPYRNPFLTAKSAATVDVLSNGRLIMGIGVGYMRGEYQALGIDFETRGAAMDETLVTMKAAWGEEPATMQGARFLATGIYARPRPVQQPNPTIWSGGNSDRAIRRAAEHCDGWSPFFAEALLSKTARTEEMTTVEQLKDKIGKLRVQLERVGRTRPFDVCIGPKDGLKDRSAAEVDRYVNEAGRLAEIGVTWMGAGGPHSSRQAWLEHVQWMGEELFPKLHALKPAELALA
jgi:probable F420-dependent oxidoreductase